MAANKSITATFTNRWFVCRAEANEDASALDLTSAGDFANKPAGAFEIPSNEDSPTIGYSTLNNNHILAFSGGAAAGKTFSWKLYVYRISNGMAELVADGTAELGTQAVVTYPQGGSATNKFWADKITVTNDYWPAKVLKGTNNENNSVDKIIFDGLGISHIYVEISAADGVSGTEAGNVTCYWTGV